MQKTTLKSLLTIKNGVDYRNCGNGCVPVYGSGGYITSIDSFLYDGESILLPRKGTLENIMFVSGKFWTVDTIYWTIINTKLVDTYYLFNYLKMLDLSNFRTGTTLPSMTNNAYYGITVFLPSIAKQKDISVLLRYIDSKIDINNKINAELEATAKDLYNYWFVQFDFPDGNGRPYKSSGGKMVYNPILKREIPDGWTVENFNNYVNIVSGFSFNSSSYESDGCWKIVTIKNVKDNDLDLSNVETITNVPKKMPDYAKLEIGDILISLTGNVGRMCFVDSENLLLNQRVGKIIAKDRFSVFSATYAAQLSHVPLPNQPR